MKKIKSSQGENIVLQRCLERTFLTPTNYFLDIIRGRVGGRVISDGEVLLFPWKANSVVLFQICTRLRSQQRGMEVEYKSSPDHQREHRAGFYLQILKPWNWRLCTLNLHSHASKSFFLFEKNNFNWFYQLMGMLQIVSSIPESVNSGELLHPSR